jgi:hypothetical protein
MKRYTLKSLWLFACIAFVSMGLLAVPPGAPAETAGKDGMPLVPGVIEMKYIKNLYGPVTFDHAMHASLAGDCGKCHHQHDKIRSTCSGCHSLTPDQFKVSVKSRFLPCSGCHADYSPDRPEMPGLKVALHKKCFGCHVGIKDLGASPSGCAKTCHARRS